MEEENKYLVLDNTGNEMYSTDNLSAAKRYASMNDMDKVHSKVGDNLALKSSKNDSGWKDSKHF